MVAGTAALDSGFVLVSGGMDRGDVVVEILSSVVDVSSCVVDVMISSSVVVISCEGEVNVVWTFSVGAVVVVSESSVTVIGAIVVVSCSGSGVLVSVVPTVYVVEVSTIYSVVVIVCLVVLSNCTSGFFHYSGRGCGSCALQWLSSGCCCNTNIFCHACAKCGRDVDGIFCCGSRFFSLRSCFYCRSDFLS